jgi:hypothetical protein
MLMTSRCFWRVLLAAIAFLWLVHMAVSGLRLPQENLCSTQCRTEERRWSFELNGVWIDRGVYEFLDEFVVLDPAEGFLDVQKDRESALPQVGITGGIGVEFKDRVDGELLGPESELRGFFEIFPVMFRRDVGRYKSGFLGSFPGLGIIMVLVLRVGPIQFNDGLR